MNWFLQLNPVLQALLATLFTWGFTATGAALVFVLRKENRWLLDVMLGFTAGVMLAASFWSLLAPAIEMAEISGIPGWLPAAVGLALGAVSLRLTDRVLPHVHLFLPVDQAEGIHTRWRRTTLLVLAITMHNIPEGLAVGVAFGAAAQGLPAVTALGAVALALGIGIQNLPEGLAVSMSLRREGVSAWRSFWYGQLSGIVEPLAGVAGAAAVVIWRPLLPYTMAFAAGAMIFVVIEEVVPEAQSSGNADAATMGAICGFIVMMALDVSLS
jgi:ZIP family zinc transporter